MSDHIDVSAALRTARIFAETKRELDLAADFDAAICAAESLLAERDALKAQRDELREACHGVDTLYSELHAAMPALANTPAWDVVQDAVGKARAALAATKEAS